MTDTPNETKYVLQERGAPPESSETTISYLYSEEEAALVAQKNFMRSKFM